MGPFALAAPEGATVRGPQAEFGGRVRISRANESENFRVSEKGKASFSVHYIPN